MANNGATTDGAASVDGLRPADEYRIEPLEERGSTGLVMSSGRVNEEWLKQLAGTRAVLIYKEMRDNDAMCGAILFAIDMILRGVKWHAEPADESDAAMEAKEFIESCMNDMSMTWADTISEILSMLPFGWSYHEICYKVRRQEYDENGKFVSKYDDGRIGWAKWPIRAQETLHQWDVDESGSIRGMIQSAWPTYERVFIPIQKALLFRTKNHKGNPEGRSIFRNAFRSWYFKRRIEEIEGIGVERDLAGLPVMYVDPSIMRDDAPQWKKAIYAECQRIVVNIRRDQQEGVILPMLVDDHNNQLMRLELLSSGGSRQFDTSGIIERYNKQIAMTVLADFILLGHESVGSFALSSDKTDLFAIALGAWLDSIQEVINNYAIPRLWQLNGFPFETMPRIVHGDIETPPLTEIASYIQQLVAAGVPLFPNQKLEDYLHDVANLPKLTPDEREQRDLEQEIKEEEERERQEEMMQMGGGFGFGGGGFGGF